MHAAAALTMALALAGPEGLQALHSLAAEQSQAQHILDRVSATDPAARPRRPPEPPTEDQRRAAAWRADHLTCASRQGRSREQYAAECGAWAAGQAAREASH